MAGPVKVKGLADLRKRIIQMLPRDAVLKQREVNEQNAGDFFDLVESVIPRDRGKLAGTLKKRASLFSPTATEVTIGGPEAPYPLHLAAGHRAADGSHVPPEDFWFAPLYLVKKRTKARSARALNAVVRKFAAEKLAQND